MSRISIHFLFTTVISVLFSTSCAYIQFERTYVLYQNNENARLAGIVDAIENYFVIHGFKLAERYHESYPGNVFVFTYSDAGEDLKEREESRRQLKLIIVKKENSVILFHSEWFCSGIVCGKDGERPIDIIAANKDDLKRYVQRRAGATIDFTLERQSN